MMKVKMMKHSIVLALMAAAGPAIGATAWSEARNDAMGGTGVASSGWAGAALVNPALMTRHAASDDVGIILPGVGAKVSDPDNLRDGIDRVQDAWTALNASSGTDARTQAAALNNALRNVSGDNAGAGAGVSAVITIPNETLPFALVLKGWGQAKARTVVTDHDLLWLDAVQTGLVPAGQQDLNQLTSRAEGVAALVSEYGLAMAHQFTLAGTPVSVGITPKFQRVDTWNYNVSVSDYNTSDFHDGEWKRSENGGNVDLGLSARLTPEWTLGLTAQNLVSRDVNTLTVNDRKDTFQIRPQATAGASWSNGVITLATDVDLTPASGFASDAKAQYAGVGAEVNAWDLLQLRAGYRADMRGHDQNVVTAGVGISPFNVVHLDLTGMAGTDRTYGAVAQLTFTF
ncbi:conjugal transfer protein TraF [Erwinia psidii]|uniref:Conjugal transfer protein TraF n=2 Tax=Erwinia psidii TaxID=69224 RepID=A0A3N6UPS4_9GAMM|nr:conjugal transfer protein TraF [Erwinia psidii]MCX8965241.1 conjugal transfer protein TraF [Erwinia psidii]RQM37959.1 conjugal transfer protein TraF [Erwinia psidii]